MLNLCGINNALAISRKKPISAIYTIIYFIIFIARMRFGIYLLVAGVVMTPLFSISYAQDQSLEDLMQQLSASEEATPTGAVAPTTPDPTFNAAEVKIQNTSYTYNGNEYTLTFTPLPGTSKVEISVKNADTDMDYAKVETIAGSAGSAKVNLTSPGTYMIKFTPVDDLSTPLGPDQIMTIKVEDQAPVVTPPTPGQPTPAPTSPAEVQNPPQVGPASDLLLGGLVLIAILYFVYRFRAND